MGIGIEKECSEIKLKKEIQEFVNKSVRGLRHKEINVNQLKVKEALAGFRSESIKNCEDIACELLYAIEYCRLDKTVNPIKKANYHLKSAFLNELFNHGKKNIKNEADKACGLVINALKDEQNIKSRNNLRLFAKAIVARFGLPKYLMETLKDEEKYSTKNLIRRE
ncbi:MAG: hypothetical protein M1331_00165 [Candidatus Marsarchaeota archaeon]|nr:hypothetical protein [Candidatus Marsarchaeota archaeon]